MGASPSTLQTCLNAICAPHGDDCVSYPSATNLLYQSSWVQPYNLAIDTTPAAVIRPTTADEVAAAVTCAVNNGVKIQARSGGHSYANFGLGDGAITVDLVNLQGFAMDNSTWYASIGGGMNLGDVDDKMEPTGRVFAHGVCPGVGIGGHATIGGLGPMSRMWGAALDHIVEVEVVTADGSVIRANEQQNSDIFLGLRGAGASFGIITEFVMRTHPAPADVVQFSFTFLFGDDPSQLADAYIAWQTLINDPDLDRRFGTELVVLGLGMIITGTFYGNEDEFTATGILEKLPQNGTLTVTDYLGSLAAWAEHEALYLGNLASNFYAKSLGLRQQDVLSKENATSMFEFLRDQDKGTLLWFIVFDATGGAVADVATDATAYAHRNKYMFYQSYAVDLLSLSDTTKTFLSNFHETFVGYLPADDGDRGTYPGYVDLDIDGTPQQEYWEGNLPVLEGIKATWDPNDVFHNPQSVQPASSG